MPKDPTRRYREETRWIHGRFHAPEWSYRDHLVPPVSASAAYRLESAERGAAGFQAFANPELNRHDQSPIYIYERLDEPSRSMLEARLADAEGAETGVCFATGMAAIAASLGVLLRTGDTVLAHRTLYGCTYSLLTGWMPRLGIRPELLDVGNPEALDQALEDPDVQVVYCESVTNPTLELLDLPRIREQVARANARRSEKERRVFLVVDNTFATPWCLRPLEHGADLVVHSLTKNIGGFGTDMGGVVVGPRLLEPDLLLYRKDFGGALSPKAAWPALVHGLPTLPLRSRRQIATATALARFLEQHPLVASVRYPGLPSHPQHELAGRLMRDPEGGFAPGTLVYFTLAGEPDAALVRGRQVMNHLAKHALTVTLAVSLGQIRTLIEHPASMTHAPIPLPAQIAAGIEPGGIRLSLGLEDPRDIIADLSTSLDAPPPSP